MTQRDAGSNLEHDYILLFVVLGECFSEDSAHNSLPFIGVIYPLTRVRQKVKGLFRKKHIHCKYTETKLILLFDVIPLDFNTPVPAFHKCFNCQKKKFFGCVFNHFAPHQCIPHRTKIFFLLELLSLGQTYGSLHNVVHCDSSVFPYRSFNDLNTVLSP
jgi:hypothetical protein